MADISDVEQALVACVSGALYDSVRARGGISLMEAV